MSTAKRKKTTRRSDVVTLDEFREEIQRTVQDVQMHVQHSLKLLESKIDNISSDVAGLVAAQQGNIDTSPEDVERYLNRIGRMIASSKYAAAHIFLRNVFKWVEEKQFITRKMMKAVDRIEENPPVRSQYTPGEENYMDWIDEF